MRIGLINELNGRTSGEQEPPTWESISQRARIAEEVGFDIFVFEDALLYRGEKSTNGLWESMTVAAALAATTSQIDVGQSVINSPYRSPALTASMATTLDEISGGRYVLGIGAGNTPDSDYEAFGFPTDYRYSRFAEAIEIIHSLLKSGEANFEGNFYTAKDAELVLRGPSPQGPRINIAAGGPKMLGLVAKYGDEWNWWSYDETLEELRARFKPILDTLELALEDESRDPDSLMRTIDLYSFVPPGLEADHGMDNPVTGSAGEIVEFLGHLEQLGFEEVRCDLYPKTAAAVEAMAQVVSQLD